MATVENVIFLIISFINLKCNQTLINGDCNNRMMEIFFTMCLDCLLLLLFGQRESEKGME